MSATAFIHSIQIQEKRDALKIWNYSLIIVTFILCVFGTYLTRSGVLQSIHAFATSGIGIYFLGFLALLTGVSVYALLSNLPRLRSGRPIESLLSRESSFLFNNILFVCLTFTVFFGTMFPLISELFTGDKIEVGIPFFNRINTPISSALIFLIGLCPAISWGKASPHRLKTLFLRPFLASFLIIPVLLLLGVGKLFLHFSFVLGSFVLITILTEIFRETSSRSKRPEGQRKVGLVRLFAERPKHFGGHVVHAGMVLVFLGIASSSLLKTSHDVLLKPGETTTLKSYTIKYVEPVRFRTAQKDAVRAKLELFSKGREIAEISPEKNLFFGWNQPTTEVAIHSDMRRDIYAILSGLSEDDYARLEFIHLPLVSWLWTGGILIMGGTSLCFFPPRRKGMSNYRKP